MTNSPDNVTKLALVENKPNKDGLTQKQLAFCRLLVTGGEDGLGLTQVEAYRQAGYATETMADKTCWEAASRLACSSKVSARIKVLRRRAEEAVLHSGVSLRQVVARELLALSLNPTDDDGVEIPEERRRDADRISALRQLGSLAHVGAYVERTAEVDSDADLTADEQLDLIREKLKAAFDH